MGARKKIKRKEKASLLVTLVIVAVFLTTVSVVVILRFWDTSAVPMAQGSSGTDSNLLSVSSQVSESEEAGSSTLLEPEEGGYSALPESAEVGDGYFDDAVFIGDSLMMGLGAYGVVEKDKVLADIGLNLDTVLSKQCITAPTGMVTVLEAVNLKKPSKIYLMMGSNGIAWVTPEDLAGKLELFLSQLMAQQPDCELYLMAIPPVTQEKFEKDSRYSNESIRQYNALLLQLAEKRGVHYLDINSAFQDSTGALNMEYAEADGMHFKKVGYDHLYQYLKTHTAATTPAAGGEL